MECHLKHDDVSGNYCPNCGEPLCPLPLAQLERHLRIQKEASQNRLDKRGPPPEPGQETLSWPQRHHASASRSLAKWTSWLEALQELKRGKTVDEE